MNTKKEWEELLELANEDLKKYNIWMKISEEDGFFTLYLVQGGRQPYTFAENYYEDELCELINDAWAHARAKGKHEKRQEENKIPALDRTMHLLCETIQEVTLVAWPIIYGPHNEYDQDSREVLETIRRWGWEFENWWLGHTDEWIDNYDYIEEVEKFADRKCKEYLKEIGVDPEAREQKDYIVHITRIEKYEGTVSVKATSKEEAEEKVKDAWGDGKHDEIYEDMTENIDCDSQTYDAHEAQPGEKADFAI